MERGGVVGGSVGGGTTRDRRRSFHIELVPTGEEEE